MVRCANLLDLRVHYKQQQAEPTLENAVVLCRRCFASVPGLGKPGQALPDFPEDVKARAIAKAGNRCECTSYRGCH
jgi:hypothetical protein